MTNKNGRPSGDKAQVQAASMLEIVAKIQSLSGKPIVSHDISVVTAEQLVADETIAQPTYTDKIRTHKIK